jgi:hypothetical protein
MRLIAVCVQFTNTSCRGTSVPCIAWIEAQTGAAQPCSGTCPRDRLSHSSTFGEVPHIARVTGSCFLQLGLSQSKNPDLDARNQDAWVGMSAFGTKRTSIVQCLLSGVER